VRYARWVVCRGCVRGAALTLALASSACTLLIDTDGFVSPPAADATAPEEAAAPKDASGADVADATAPSRYEQTVLEDAPILYLRLDEPASSLVVTDRIAAVEGRVSGSVELGVPGAIVGDPNGAARFDNGVINLGDVASFAGDAPFSIEVWIAPDPIEETYWSVLAKLQMESEAAPGSVGYQIGVTPVGGRGSYFTRLSVTHGDFLQSSIQPSAGTFTHLVGVFTGLEMRIYVDGALAATRASAASLPSAAMPLQIGRFGGDNSAFRGVVDEVAIYDHALPQARVTAHYRAGRGL
jgi:hypothetical protein